MTFDDEAYDLLRSAKLTPKESFSHVVKRTLGRCAAWDDTGDRPHRAPTSRH